jgi:hypothetical protein
VLADGEAEDVGRIRKLESVAGRVLDYTKAKWTDNPHGSVVRKNGLLLELELLEVIRLEDLASA